MPSETNDKRKEAKEEYFRCFVRGEDVRRLASSSSPSVSLSPPRTKTQHSNLTLQQERLARRALREPRLQRPALSCEDQRRQPRNLGSCELHLLGVGVIGLLERGSFPPGVGRPGGEVVGRLVEGHRGRLGDGAEGGRGAERARGAGRAARRREEWRMPFSTTWAMPPSTKLRGESRAWLCLFFADTFLERSKERGDISVNRREPEKEGGERGNR